MPESTQTITNRRDHVQQNANKQKTMLSAGDEMKQTCKTTKITQLRRVLIGKN